jgi:hypothetical protein
METQHQYFIKGGGVDAGTVWSASRGGEDELPSDGEYSDDSLHAALADLSGDDETEGWIQQQREKIALAPSRGGGSDVSDLSTDDDMEAELAVPAPSVRPRRPGRKKNKKQQHSGPAVKFAVEERHGVAPADGAKQPQAAAAAARGATSPDDPSTQPAAPGAPPPPTFHPQTLTGAPVVQVAVQLPSSSSSSDGDDGRVNNDHGVEQGVDQAPPAWMFSANAGAPNKRYLQKLEEPKKQENKAFRAKFLVRARCADLCDLGTENFLKVSVSHVYLIVRTACDSV